MKEILLDLIKSSVSIIEENEVEKRIELLDIMNEWQLSRLHDILTREKQVMSK